MKYIGSNGVQTLGGTDFGSGLGIIPSSSLMNLGGMGNEISGAGQLGSFGSMPNQFAVVGVGQANQAAPGQPAPQPQVNSAALAEQRKAQEIANAIIQKEKEDKSNSTKKLLLYGAVAAAGIFAYTKWMGGRESSL